MLIILMKVLLGTQQLLNELFILPLMIKSLKELLINENAHFHQAWFLNLKFIQKFLLKIHLHYHILQLFLLNMAITLLLF